MQNHGAKEQVIYKESLRNIVELTKEEQDLLSDFVGLDESIQIPKNMLKKANVFFSTLALTMPLRGW